jgi:hypothetical protein
MVAPARIGGKEGRGMNTHRPPRKVAGFTWGRVSPDAGGGSTYRLFWRAHNGRLRMLAWKFPAGTPRRDIARELRRLRNNARVMRALDRSKAA